MLYREILETLTKWKNDDNKKALCIIGARQIGKTTIIEQFAKDKYENFIEINFVTDENAEQIFAGSLDANTIISNITAYTMKELIPGKTLIFFDEIQNCPNARTAIKFLVQDGRFDYIESGSLLGTKYKEIKSYPVGFEKIVYMYPMNFKEFAIANGLQNSTIKLLEKHYSDKTPVTDSIHTTMMNLLYAYIVVGGMPAVVQSYIDNHDIRKVVDTQKEILELYRQSLDNKSKLIFDNILNELNNKNKRFFLNHINRDARYNRYVKVFTYLKSAGVVLPCYNVNAPVSPLMLNEKRNLFKLFMNDVGLLCATSIENIQFPLLNGDLTINMGSVLENMIAQQIVSNGYNLNYFDSKKYGEIDFVIQNGTKVDLIEVKSGNDYTKHHALSKISQVDDWNFHNKLVFCKGNIQVNGDITYYPLYMIMFYKPKELPEHFIHKIDLSGL